MHTQALNEFENTVQREWVGRTVQVTKTEPVPPLEMEITDARVVDSPDVDERIRARYPGDSRFVVFSGCATASGPVVKRDAVCSVVIHVDDNTLYDIRENRLVILSDEEVVQIGAKH